MSEFDFVCSFYKADFHPDLLQAQLITFGIDLRDLNTVRGIVTYLQFLTSKSTSVH